MTAARAAEVLGAALACLRARRRSRRAAIVAALAATATIAAALAWRATHAPGPVVAIERAGPQSVRAVDAAGRQRWAHTFRGSVLGIGELRPLVARLAGGEACGILVPLGRDDWANSVTCLAAGTGRVRWTWRADWQAPVNALGRLRIEALRALPWPGTDAPAIAVTLYDAPWYSSAIQFLREDGHPLGVYYHPGPMTFVEALPPGDGGEIHYLLAGLNSSARFVRALVPFATRFHCPVLALLSPPAVGGQAFPWSEDLPEARDWPGMARAREASYLAIPPLRPDFESQLQSVQVRTGPEGEAAILVLLGDGRTLTLDRDLVPQSCYVGVSSLADSLHTAGRLQVPPLMLIRDGRTTRHDVPLSF